MAWPSERDPDVLATLHADALRSVDNQWSRLGELRSRAATLITAASIAAGFLAPRAFDGGSTVFAWLGTAAFAAVAAFATLVLWPWAGWQLHRHPWSLLRNYDREELTQTLYDLTYHLGEDSTTNEGLIQRLTVFLSGGCITLALEVVFFLIDLGVRR